MERLQRTVRDRRAGYRESIGVLEHARRANPKVVTKTSIMLGLGEEPSEVRLTITLTLALTLTLTLTPTPTPTPIPTQP